MPSILHTELTRRALVWLSNISTQKGIRACPEINLGIGYVADAGAIMNLQLDWERKFLGLKGMATKEDYFKQLTSVKDIQDDYTFIIESKASLNDFNKTFKYGKHLGDRLQPKANFHFVVLAKGIIPEATTAEQVHNIIPAFWGALQESRNGLRLIKPPSFCDHPTEYLYEFAYRILRYSDVRKYIIMDLKESHITE